MKIVDNFLSKVGTDKILHFLVGCAITSLIAFVLICQEATMGIWALGMVIPGLVLTGLLSWVKEMNDDTFDKKDILASVLGAVPPFIAIAIGLIFLALSA